MSSFNASTPRTATNAKTASGSKASPVTNCRNGTRLISTFSGFGTSRSKTARTFLILTADLREADLIGANLSGADLSEARLYRANLGGANLSRAQLGGANFSATQLIETDLRDAKLTGSSVMACRH